MMSAPTSSVPIRVLIVDDHAVVREGIAALLGRQPDMVAVGEASDGAEAVARFVELAPDVTLMDMQMGEMGGVEAIAKIRRLSPDARILVLTTYPGDAQRGPRDTGRCGRLPAQELHPQGIARRNPFGPCRAPHDESGGRA